MQSTSSTLNGSPSASQQLLAAATQSSTHEQQQLKEERKQFMQPTQEDPLRKREQFAVSLRKKKTQSIIKNKRRRMLESRANGIANGQSLSDCNKDMKSPEYSQFHKFADQAHFAQLVKEIAPEFQSLPGVIEKTQYSIERLQTVGQTLSLEHQLALVTCLRKQFSVVMDDTGDTENVLRNTSILSTIHSMLCFQSQEEEAYFLKIEALWLLTNLAYVNEEDTLRILGSSIDVQDMQKTDINDLKMDFKHNKSIMLDAINALLKQKMNENGKDVKTISFIFEALLNIVVTNKQVASKVVTETCILHSFRHLLDVCSSWNTEMLSCLYQMIDVIVQLDTLAVHDIQACFNVTAIGMLSPLKDVQTSSLKSMTKLLSSRPELINQVGPELLRQAVTMMKEKDSDLHQTALQFVSHCFSGSDPKHIDIGLANDVLYCYDQLLMSPSTTIIKESLWGLSNITAGTQQQAAAFLAEQDLYRKVIGLMSHSHSQLRGEALWTISNLISTAESSLLKQLFEKENTELVKPLCEALIKGHDAELIKNIMSALQSLLNLDEQYKDCFIGYDSISSTIEQVQGFDKIEQLATSHPNHDVFILAQAIMQRYRDSGSSGFAEESDLDIIMPNHNQQYPVGAIREGLLHHSAANMNQRQNNTSMATPMQVTSQFVI